MSACPVFLANGKKRDGAFECLDPATELNSCGGCIGQGGVDCEALPGVASVSCQQSQCVVSRCKSGFSLFDNACIA
ncbi:hypothetical protein BT69DRAFT_1286504 [Atractiella rhizophila]|nr:hypothetical protein BT69DRAFT_1288573 [Atractiella rhizophila]KAH8917599.1 hypothetical protein BT69DRAFT_1286504 [Atractiella rhizophila]